MPSISMITKHNNNFNKLLLSLIIFLLVISSVISCRIDICSREYESVHEFSQIKRPTNKPDPRHCQMINAYSQCIRSIAKSCRGHLQFQAIQTLLRNWKIQFNCTNHHHLHGSSSGIKHPKNSPPVKAGSFPNTPFNLHHFPPDNHQQRIIQQQQRLQNCLSAAYNYTINQDIELLNVRDERIKLVPSSGTGSSSSSSGTESYDSEKVISDNGYVELQSKKSNNLRRLKTRIARDTIGSQPVKVLLNSDDDDDNNDQSDSVDEDEEDDNDDSENNSNNNNGKTESHPQGTIPLVPTSPPLTCIMYGDPHLRTFNNHYQTCKCLGAWPLIDHPLFAVQITNSQFKDSSTPQITGISKVTVLVRQFTRCGIQNDLLYEAESGSNPIGSLPATFIDGRSSTPNNLIRIASSSNNNVITIHLDHIGVRVYIGQFISSRFLNIVIKFRSATSTVKQQLVLNSISSNSLCKVGCSQRERVDIKSILLQNGVNYDTVTPSVVNQELDEYTRVVLSSGSQSNGNKQSDEPCKGLYGYYRISCLYEVAIKGLKDSHNAARFAQSFDEMKIVTFNSTFDQNNINHHYDSTKSHQMYNSQLPTIYHFNVLFIIWLFFTIANNYLFNYLFMIPVT